MPQYCFVCRSTNHKGEDSRHFVAFVHLDPQQLKHGKNVEQYLCPTCGDYADRDLAGEIPSQQLVGLTPISEATSGKGSLYRETAFAFGNAQGKAAFRDSGEMNKFLNGHNNLGPPEVSDNGEPLRDKQGNFIRKGEKFVKYDRQATPRRTAPKPNPNVERAFVDYSELQKAGVVTSSRPATAVPGVRYTVPRHRSPERRKR